MVDIDWFLAQSNKMIEQVEQGILIGQDEIAISAAALAALGMWANVRLMQSGGMVVLSEDQQREVDYLKLKLVQFSNYLPEGSDHIAIITG